MVLSEPPHVLGRCLGGDYGCVCGGEGVEVVECGAGGVVGGFLEVGH